MKKSFFSLLFLALIISCSHQSPDLGGTEKIKPEDFLKAFHVFTLPTTIADTSLKTISDTTSISKIVFTQFIADTALKAYYVKSKIHPAGIIHKKDKDYLLATFTLGKKIQLGVFVLDDKHKFLASYPLLDNSKKDSYDHSVSITEEPTFIVKREKLSADKTSLYSRNGYAYSASSNTFSEVLHDSNEDTARLNQIINPIDTLPKTFKYSGDYVADKKNFISVRDGKKAQSYLFFIHFENNNGDCTGELKGEMIMTNDKEAVFTENGDPCVINFTFSTNSIKIKEQGNCGNHRGITCLFDFSFRKKTEPHKKNQK
ncbi:MAG: hypothetical protein JST21_01565 [Bacteroidetes bacterium]|nr:hypothetical protein [Bacteroidota bacterium]